MKIKSTEDKIKEDLKKLFFFAPEDECQRTLQAHIDFLSSAVKEAKRETILAMIQFCEETMAKYNFESKERKGIRKLVETIKEVNGSELQSNKAIKK